MMRYQLRTVSGRQYVWEGDLYELLAGTPKNGHGVDLLPCPGGTLVNLAHVEAFEPME